jgi:hypothetical protein
MEGAVRPGPIFQLIWALWIAAFLMAEFYGVGRPGPGDTLTEATCWWASISVWVKIALSFFWVWLAVHMLSRYWWRALL